LTPLVGCDVINFGMHVLRAQDIGISPVRQSNIVDVVALPLINFIEKWT
jgi:hypothetical protein